MHPLSRTNAARREISAAERIPYAAHVSAQVVRTSFGDYLQTFRLGGAGFETTDDEDLNNWHERSQCAVAEHRRSQRCFVDACHSARRSGIGTIEGTVAPIISPIGFKQSISGGSAAKRSCRTSCISVCYTGRRPAWRHRLGVSGTLQDAA
jgi:hypothetical protein